VLAAVTRSPGNVVIDDIPDPGRRGLATAIGAAGAVWGDPEDIVAAASDWTDGDGPPLIVEASGAGPALRLATETVRLAGRYRAAIAKLLTHRFPLTATAEAFEFAMKREPGAVKTQITVSESSEGATKT
jgi:threonine dehydrogenase-like Zn-dependent dehydrogenase